MTQDARLLLRRALQERIAGEQRRAVLVLGSGLHQQLLGMAAATDAEWDGAAAFWSWGRLLEQMAQGADVPFVRHDDPTATWEGLIQARTTAHPASGAAQHHEDVFFRELVALLSQSTHPLLAGGAPREVVRMQCRAFFRRYQDVVTLNLDQTISSLLGAVHLTGNESRRLRERDTVKYARNVWPRFQAEQTRIWHLHGHVGSKAREGIILGMRSYGMNIAPLESARENSKQREKAWRAAAADGEVDFGVYARQHQPEALHVMDLFLHEPLVFVGCGMGWAETDLWWALHQRARNLAKIPPSQRQPVFLLMGDSPDNRSRLQSRPAGVLPVFYSDYADIWRDVGLAV